MTQRNANLTTRAKAGKGLFGWLGRQVGYVRGAVKYDPTLVARKEAIEERRDPKHPDLIFRRRVTDEVVRDTESKKSSKS